MTTPLDNLTTLRGFIVLRCPHCGKQATNDPHKFRKRITCALCKSHFRAIRPEFSFNCAWCDIRLHIPRWIIGGDIVRCPGCNGGLRIIWADEETQTPTHSLRLTDQEC